MGDIPEPKNLGGRGRDSGALRIRAPEGACTAGFSKISRYYYYYYYYYYSGPPLVEFLFRRGDTFQSQGPFQKISPWKFLAGSLSGRLDTTSILYYTILYYTIPYHTILYYTILYYTILYYTILYRITYTI